jgi:hypothetical protein
MNVPKAIELAMAEMIRNEAEMGEGVVIRAWQSLAADGSWKENPDRYFPMVDVRCSPPRTDDNQATLNVECSILMGTKTDDDKNHEFISGMFDAIQEVCDTLFSQFKNGQTTTDPLKTFLADVIAETTADKFQFGGFTFGEGLSPTDEGGVNMIGISMIVHYGRSDY